MDERISMTVTDGICTLRLERPEKLNALDTLAFEALQAHCGAIEQAGDAIACVVLRGAGRAFCAGADLGAIGTGSVDPMFKPDVIEQLAALPQPVVAAVHGVCMTGGLELALACDFIVADPSARFADTHGKWGLVGAWGMGQRLRRRVGDATAKRLMMTSQVIDADEAYRIGLADVLASGDLDETLAAFTAQIAANSAHTNRHVKRFMAQTDGLDLGTALAHERDNYPGFAPDYAERVARFSKR